MLIERFHDRFFEFVFKLMLQLGHFNMSMQSPRTVVALPERDRTPLSARHASLADRGPVGYTYINPAPAPSTPSQLQHHQQRQPQPPSARKSESRPARPQSVTIDTRVPLSLFDASVSEASSMPAPRPLTASIVRPSAQNSTSHLLVVPSARASSPPRIDDELLISNDEDDEYLCASPLASSSCATPLPDNIDRPASARPQSSALSFRPSSASSVRLQLPPDSWVVSNTQSTLPRPTPSPAALQQRASNLSRINQAPARLDLRPSTVPAQLHQSPPHSDSKSKSAHQKELNVVPAAVANVAVETNPKFRDACVNTEPMPSSPRGPINHIARHRRQIDSGAFHREPPRSVPAEVPACQPDMNRYWFLSRDPIEFRQYLATAAHSDRIRVLGQLALVSSHVARLVEAAKPVWHKLSPEIRDAPVIAVPDDVFGSTPVKHSDSIKRNARLKAEHLRWSQQADIAPPAPFGVRADSTVPVLSPWASASPPTRSATVDWTAVHAALSQLIQSSAQSDVEHAPPPSDQPAL
jgi:hypothetical protein